MGAWIGKRAVVPDGVDERNSGEWNILVKVLTLRGKNSPVSATNLELGGIAGQGARWPVRRA